MTSNMAQPRVLVTGGAGFLGINLCRLLLARGYPVRSMDIAPFAYPERDAVEAIQADIRDPDAVTRALTDVDLVVHCAAALPLAARRKSIRRTSEVRRHLLQISARGRSSVSYSYRPPRSTAFPITIPLYEQDRLHGVGAYGTAKIMAEQLCLESRSQGRCVPILRPKSFVGPERLGVFELLYEWAYEGRNFPVLGSGNNLYQLLDVADLCEVDILVLGDRRTLGERHVQRGRQIVRHHARKFSIRTGSRRPRQTNHRFAGRTGDCAAQGARTDAPFPPVSVDL